MGIDSEGKRQDMEKYDGGLILLEDRTGRKLQAPAQPSQE
jgi:hypothetical protein